MKKGNSTSSVYKITCTANKKIYYGRTLNYKGRVSAHLSCLRRGVHYLEDMQNDFLIFGEERFRFEVLRETKNMFEAAVIEKGLINRRMPSGKSYNKTTQRDDAFSALIHAKKKVPVTIMLPYKLAALVDKEAKELHFKKSATIQYMITTYFLNTNQKGTKK